MAKRASTIIAETFGLDAAEMADYLYQPTRTKQSIYAIGNTYYACGKTAPKDSVAGAWKPAKDQFWAQQANTVLWVSED